MAENLAHEASNSNGAAGVIDADALGRFVERLESIDEEMSGLREDRKEVVKEARSAGFPTKQLNTIVRERRMDTEERADWYASMDAYRSALGMLSDTPLGEAAVVQLEKKRGRGRSAGA